MFGGAGVGEDKGNALGLGGGEDGVGLREATGVFPARATVWAVESHRVPRHAAALAGRHAAPARRAVLPVPADRPVREPAHPRTLREAQHGLEIALAKVLPGAGPAVQYREPPPAGTQRRARPPRSRQWPVTSRSGGPGSPNRAGLTLLVASGTGASPT